MSTFSRRGLLRSDQYGNFGPTPEPIGQPAVDDGRPQSWPKVVGIISIVWGSIGLMCGLCGVGSLLMMGTLTKTAEAQIGPMPAEMQPTMLQVSMTAISTLWSVFLLVAGILLVTRRDVARPLHLTYGIVGVLLGLITLAVSVHHQLNVQAFANANPDNAWVKQSPPAFGWISIVIATLLGLAYPLFCSFWFGVVKRNEPVRPPAEVL